MGGWQSMFGVISGRLPNCVTQAAVATYFRVSAFRKLGFRGTHSIQTRQQGEKMQIQILPALSDNYMYLLVDEKSKETAVVDPVEPDTVLRAIKDAGLNLTTVLITHHHWDHAGGNKALLAKAPGLTVLGGDSRYLYIYKSSSLYFSVCLSSIHPVILQVSIQYTLSYFRLVFTTPCHTSGHICYYVTDENQKERIVFTGDTLFLGGCGRFFEGTAEQMFTALIEKLSALPDITKVYSGHEYALQNLAYGEHVEPENQYIKDKIQWCRAQRESVPPIPTVPSTIAEEKLINPFMRVQKPAVQAHAKSTDDIEVMRALRTEKDNFKSKK
ncbi:hydroxyacylglutathione hydrolase, mitochondrial [Eurytemora carolleeae]|uniref:hydroxyacylglutathione hydrolase, mitochondrial n=1 Tax=Eurytemora carolleeae TaxID=1294199 RepID=UPI000C75E344|nr:hydroxyacylglutathione hydrolase, mitochondrial [Eurytemora carolleeae]|eukprot:XP_023345761.1 hydroxyacylglutathione hydrolase, mitochondrial-like [Eurytemora affinis]